MTPYLTPTITLTLILTAVTFGYLLACWVAPFGYCRRCRGMGRYTPRLGRTMRLCRRCDGTGRRLRIGRYAINQLRRLHNQGTR